MTEDKKNLKKTAGRKKKKTSAAKSAAKSAAASATPVSAEAASDSATLPVSPDTKFEDAFDELEQIVGRLEDGEQSLQDSLAQFERGIALARFCQKNLSEAEQKVLVLTSAMESVDTEWESADTENLEPFDIPGNSDSE